MPTHLQNTCVRFFSPIWADNTTEVCLSAGFEKKTTLGEDQGFAGLKPDHHFQQQKPSLVIA